MGQFKTIADSFLSGCDNEMQEEVVRRLGLLVDKGVECKMPVSEPIGDGLFSLHARSGRIRARLLYYFGENKQIIFVHAFYKATRKISREDIDIAKRNRNLIKEGKEKLHGIDFPIQTKSN